MNYEKRLFLAMGLSFGILILWSALAPPPVPKTSPVSGPQILTTPSEIQEPVEPFHLKLYRLGIGSLHGGIRAMEMDGRPLLKESDPGLLEIREPGQTRSLALKTQAQEETLFSEGALSPRITVRRKVRHDTQRHPHLFQVELELQNEWSEPADARLEMALYKPLVALKEAEKQYLAGIAWIGTKQEAIRAHPGQRKSFPALPDWIVSQNKSDAVVVGIPRLEQGLFHVEQSLGGSPAGWVEFGPIHLAPGQRVHWEFPLYVGPMVLSELKKIGMEGTLSFGAFSGITRWLLRFLNWGERHFHSYGWAICFLSLVVWLPFSPLTFYGMRMSQQMQSKMAALKPQEARIRKEHEKNPQKLQKELMELYRKHKVNPASGCLGCLPFLLTWPIYIALFAVLNRAPELRGASFFWIRDLALPDRLIRFPAVLPILGDHLNLLPFFAAAGTFLQQRAMQKPSLELTEEQRIQQQMFKIFPLLFVVIFYNLPSGFMLYWVINSVLMGGQQLFAARLSNR